MFSIIFLINFGFLITISSGTLLLENLNNDIEPIIEIPNGKIRGVLHKDENYISFESIPYAEPPINENRFESPKEYTKQWNNIRNATQLPSPCIQWADNSPSKPKILGDEDCLYLNIYIPLEKENKNTDSPRNSLEKLLPVILFIHGGAFMFGSGGASSPEFIMKYGKFIYVNFNYRLGVFGFISTEDEQLSGNMGLKDQNMAIKWIKNNVQLFGGDPNKIILVGHSAGGASVHMHLLSSKLYSNENLFNVAISHSGTAFCRWAMIKNPLKRTRKLAEHLNCPTNNTKEIKNCLKQIHSPIKIIESMKIFQSFLYNPFTIFGPSVEFKTKTIDLIEKSDNIDERFLTDDPENLIKSGNVLENIPWLVSYVPDEGSYDAATLMKKDNNNIEIIEQLNDFWTQIAPNMLFFDNADGREETNLELASELKNKYLGDEKFSAQNYKKFQDMVSDTIFLEGIEKAIRLHKDYTNQTVYVYYYENPSLFGIANLISNRSDVEFGTAHADDIFLFYGNLIRKIKPLNDEQFKLANNFLDMYKNFIENGVPEYEALIMKPNTPNTSEILQLKITGNSSNIQYVQHITHK